MSVVCWLKLSLLSSVTPRYLKLSTGSMSNASSFVAFKNIKCLIVGHRQHFLNKKTMLNLTCRYCVFSERKSFGRSPVIKHGYNTTLE